MASGLAALSPTRISLTSPHFSPWSLSSCSWLKGHLALRSSKSLDALRCPAGAARAAWRPVRIALVKTLPQPSLREGSNHKATSKHVQLRPARWRCHTAMATPTTSSTQFCCCLWRGEAEGVESSFEHLTRATSAFWSCGMCSMTDSWPSAKNYVPSPSLCSLLASQRFHLLRWHVCNFGRVQGGFTRCAQQSD